jgi:hypothetical protein
MSALKGSPWGGRETKEHVRPGTTTQAYKNAMLLELNYFRAMAGVPAELTILQHLYHQCSKSRVDDECERAAKS